MYAHEHAAAAYDLIHAARGKDYRAEAECVANMIRQRQPLATRLVDVACGTGQHLAAFAELGFDVIGVEPSQAMLDAAGQRLPGVALHQGDMRTFDLDRRVDAVVCLFSAIGYMTTQEDLIRAIGAMAGHVDDYGVLVVEPWITPENWSTGILHADHANDGRLAVARVSISGRDDTTSTFEFRYVGATAGGTWEFTEHHRMGLFTVDQYLTAFEEAGLQVDHDEEGLVGRGLFIGTRGP